MIERYTSVGSPHWMAPEIVMEDGWSLGVTCIELAETKPPYHDRPPISALFKISSQEPARLQEPGLYKPEFVSFVEQCMTRNAADRPESIDLLKHPLFASLPEGFDVEVLSQFFSQHPRKATSVEDIPEANESATESTQEDDGDKISISEHSGEDPTKTPRDNVLNIHGKGQTLEGRNGPASPSMGAEEKKPSRSKSKRTLKGKTRRAARTGKSSPSQSEPTDDVFSGHEVETSLQGSGSSSSLVMTDDSNSPRTTKRKSKTVGSTPETISSTSTPEKKRMIKNFDAAQRRNSTEHLVHYKQKSSLSARKKAAPTGPPDTKKKRIPKPRALRTSSIRERKRRQFAEQNESFSSEEESDDSEQS
eukprot:CAMPEP_0168536188 /NCGR_PEP_ID=MMETSP0405-20121227/19334_1 /TAXON_ID=498012 /ORGANISM="Trichosphaerium sp, Strain Am-I-7 wt" /LENGTH=362 /DNA_ID=CAMNT_0008564013 /DNA_START=211 /DNA_END=1299 /DNA_ORIENTATION=+